MASTATSEIRDGLGDDVADLKNLRNLHPRTWLNEELGDLRGDLGGTPRGNGGPAATTAQRPDRTLAAGAAPPYDPEAT
jgi:hypothetical protein